VTDSDPLVSGLYMAINSFGKTISNARKSLGLSQRALASRLRKDDGQPISAQYLNDIEHDRRNAPEYLILLLAKELDLSADRLFLATGTFPPDIIADATNAKSESVEALFSAFRRALKGKQK
jgi:transcriptional regulator with XRE-family HTH domain